MDITSGDARKAIEDAERITGATRTVAALAGTDLAIMTWGGIWVAGFLWSHLVTVMDWTPIHHAVWFALIAVGVAVTLLIEKRRQTPVKNAAGARIGLFWWALYGYCWLGMAILGVGGNHVFPNLGADTAKAVAAVNTIIPMFAYVVMGLWLEQNFFIWMGLGFTALTAVAFFLVLPVFFPLMAVAGGGALFACGLWMRLRVRRTMAGLEHHA